jgi:hypothetical protein
VSYSFWIKSTLAPSATTDILNSGTNNEFIIQATNTAKFLFSMKGSAGAIVATTPNSTLTSGWHHIVVTMDASTGTADTTTGAGANLKVYIDNVRATLTYTSTGFSGPHTFQAAIPRIGSQLFSGNIDDLRIYNHILDTTEIGALFTGGAQ